MRLNSVSVGNTWKTNVLDVSNKQFKFASDQVVDIAGAELKQLREFLLPPRTGCKSTAG